MCEGRAKIWEHSFISYYHHCVTIQNYGSHASNKWIKILFEKFLFPIKFEMVSIYISFKVYLIFPRGFWTTKQKPRSELQYVVEKLDHWSSWKTLSLLISLNSRKISLFHTLNSRTMVHFSVADGWQGFSLPITSWAGNAAAAHVEICDSKSWSGITLILLRI